jgi:hypothetical protein
LSSVTKTILNALGAETSRRRFALQLSVGSAVLLLAACGGGGGSGLVEDDSSADRYYLRAAFDKLEVGMTPQDVIALIGRQPDSQTPISYRWQDAEGSLDVGFTQAISSGAPIGDALWTSSKEALTRVFV